MIKNILLIVMTILALMFFVFGFIQKLEADKQRDLSIALKTLAEDAKSEELKAKDMAAAAQAEADRQRAIAIECQKGSMKK